MHVAPGAQDVSLQSTISFSQFLPVNLLENVDVLGFNLIISRRQNCIYPGWQMQVYPCPLSMQDAPFLHCPASHASNSY